MLYPDGNFAAKIAIIGEFGGAQDHIKQLPFMSGSGFELMKLLGEAGISRGACYLSMVVKDNLGKADIEALVAQKKKYISPYHTEWHSKFVLPQLLAYAEEMREELERVNPNVVCAVGNLALFVLTGEWGVHNWRGSIMESTLIPGLKVIPTYNPSVLQAQPQLRPIIAADLKRVSRHKELPAIKRPEYSFTIAPHYGQARKGLEDLISLCKEAENPVRISIDIETRGHHIASIAFAPNATTSICIPLMQVGRPEGYWPLEQEAELVYLIYQLSKVCTAVGQNFNFDQQFIYRSWHFLFPRVEDTMIKQHTCFPALDKSLAFLSSIYLEDHLYWKDDRTDWKGEGEEQFWTYNCTDTVRTYAINEVLTSVIAQMGMEEVYSFQQKLAFSVLKMMNRGVAFNESERDIVASTLIDELTARNAWITYVLGHPLNIRSPKQMAKLFYEILAQKPVTKRNAEGGRSVTTDEAALAMIADREPILKPLTNKILELRSLNVFNSTFIQAKLDIDRRIRSNFNVCGTHTFRFSSSQNVFGSGLNCQNIPKGSDLNGLQLPNVRKLFIPDPGKTIFDIDLDSADLRIVTWESGCEWMKEHFREGRKPYIEIMREYYKDNSMTKSSHPKQYGMFKSLCHGSNYLGKPDGMASKLGLLVHEVERIQKWYFGLAPEIRAWQERVKSQVRNQRCISNVFGYKFQFFGKIEETTYNEAVAWIPQSSVACLINRAFLQTEEVLPEIEILLQVHDSLVGQFPTSRKDYYMEQLKKTTLVTLPYADPLIIPTGIVTSDVSWGDCE